MPLGFEAAQHILDTITGVLFYTISGVYPRLRPQCTAMDTSRRTYVRGLGATAPCVSYAIPARGLQFRWSLSASGGSIIPRRYLNVKAANSSSANQAAQPVLDNYFYLTMIIIRVMV